MGREAKAHCQWHEKQFEARVLLESTEIILRGDNRARIARTEISEVAVLGDALVLTVGSETLVVELGAPEAEKWREFLLRPLPTLAEKLGIAADTRVFGLGWQDVPELAEALCGNIVATIEDANLLVAVLRSEADLQYSFALAKRRPDVPFWCVYGKGKAAPIGDAAIRSFLRAKGLVDSKSCAVSAEMTATRYGFRDAGRQLAG